MLESENRSFTKNFHWLHWLVISGSVVLTMSAWYVSKQHVEEKVRSQFDREVQQTVDLVRERMQKYEDGLWGGVSMIHSHGGEVNHRQWKTFADNLNIDTKYPGINGIGVIFQVGVAEKQEFLKLHEAEQEGFRIHPAHSESEYWPITYIEPLDVNRAALGLDMAHEKNRFTAAKKARDTGQAQITGPILLVQDAAKTPGFLFYAPLYAKKPNQPKDGKGEFVGLVYAPFVMNKLMEGTLHELSRHVSVKISDQAETLYDEHFNGSRDFDPDPLFRTEKVVSFYGRQWTFDIWSSKDFRAAAADKQPMMILVGGITIDLLILALFFLMSRTKDEAVKVAQSLSLEADENRAALANASKLAAMGEMAGGIAHEINNPLAIIQGHANRFNRLVQSDDMTKETSQKIFEKIDSGIFRISGIVTGLRHFSRDASEDPSEVASNEEIVYETLNFCQEQFKNNQIQLITDVIETTKVRCRKVQVSQVLINLLNNARFAVKDSENPLVKVSTGVEGDQSYISVTDSGPGVPKDIKDKIFEPFFTTKPVGEGTGLGLSISKGLLEAHGGNLKLSETEEGTCFTIYLPVISESRVRKVA